MPFAELLAHNDAGDDVAPLVEPPI